MNSHQFLLKLNLKEKPDCEKESKIKESVFYLLHILLKYPDREIWIQIIGILIEMIQFLAFPFSLIFQYIWKQYRFFIQINNFLHYFQGVSLIFNNELIYFILFYTCVVVVSIIIIWLLVVIISISHIKAIPKFMLSSLRTILILVSTVFFLPFLQILCSPFKCVNPDEILRHEEYLRKLTVNYYVPTLTCSQSIYWIHMVFGAVFYLIFVLIVGIAVVTLYESKINTNITLNGRISSDFDKMKYLTKIVLSLAFCFFGKKSNDWIMIIVLCLFSVILMYTYITKKPCLNQTVTLLYFISISLFSWANIILLIGKLLEASTFDGCLPLFIIGIPIIIVSIMFYDVDIYQILMKKINNFRKGIEALRQIRLLLYVIDNRESSRAAQIILKGYASQYQTKTCFGSLNQYNELVSEGTEPFALLLQHVESLFQIALARFPTCVQLRIIYSFYLLEYMNKKHKANKELLLAEKNASSFSETFMIFRSKKLIEEHTTVINNNDNNIDFVSFLNYKNDFIQFKQMIQKITLLYYDFWSLLLIQNEDQEHLAKLNDFGTNIISSVENVQNLVDKMQKIKSKDHELLSYYSDFLNDILNDQEKALYYKNQRNKTEETKQVIDDAQLVSLNPNILSTSDEYQYISISGKSDYFGNITNISLGVCLLLGYSKKELVGQMSELIMPKIFHEAHKKLLITKLNNFKKDMININTNDKPVFKTIQTFAQTKSHYIIPIKFKTTIIQSETHGITFLAKIDSDAFSTCLNKPSICYILTNNHFIIQNFTVNAINLLGMTSWALNNNVEVISFISQFHQEFLKLVSEKEEITQDEKNQIKKKIASTIFKKPSLINWRPHEMQFEQKFRSTKMNESNISGDCIKNKSNNQEYFYLTIDEAIIGGKHKGYIFKFESSTFPSQPFKGSLINSVKEDFLTLRGINSSKLNSPQQHTIDKDKSLSPLLDMNYEQYKILIPKGQSYFQIDLDKMSFVQNQAQPNKIKEEIKAKAFKKIKADLNEDDKKDNTSSIEENSNKSSVYSSRDSEEVELESEDIENEAVNEVQSKQIINTKVLQSVDDFYKVNMQNIKLSLYSYEKKTVIELPNFIKKSQIEKKIYDEEDDYHSDNNQLQLSKGIKTIELFQDNDKNNNLNQEQLLTQQIKYALSKKEAQSTIIKLKWVVISIIVFNLLYGSIWLGLLIKTKTTIDNNFCLIKNSYQLLLNCLITQAIIRDLTILEHENYTTLEEKPPILKIAKEQISLFYYENYDLMNYLLLNTFKLPIKHQMALFNETFEIRVIQDIFSYKTFNMTLSSALVELNIAGFHIFNDITRHESVNNNIFFYIHNINNGITIQLEKLTAVYLEDYEEIVVKIRMSFYIMMALGFAILFGYFYIFSCSFKAVVKRKESYLEVFFEIGSNVIKSSLVQCERLIKKLQLNSITEYLAYDEESCVIDDNMIINSPEIKKKDQSSPKNQNSKSKEILRMKIAYCVFVAFIIIYQGSNYGALTTFLNQLTIYIKIVQSQNEVNIEYNKLLRNTREFLFDDNILIEHQKASVYYIEFLNNFYVVIKQKRNSLLRYRNNFPVVFSELYYKLYHSNLCGILNVNKLVCSDTTLSKITEYGMTSTLSIFIDESRILKNKKIARNKIISKHQFKYNLTYIGTSRYYELLPDDESEYDLYFEYSPINLFNTETYRRVRTIYEFFLKESFAMLSDELHQEIEKFVLNNSIKFYCISGLFLFFIVCIYFFAWKPFETRLITIIFKTKNMLSIIPKEVLASLTNIRKLLNITSMSTLTGISEKKLS